ncbi:MAG TPA: hypothetical protein VM285_11760 [Polyangia bacterium]|nr:hypothetical protein [Polyangia bacterium]
MKKVLGLVLVVLTMGLIASCDAADKLCGPCGDVYAGDDFISGDARLDGIFKAVGSFGSATAAIDASFNADVMALGEVFGLAKADMEGLEIDALVELVKGEIETEIDANVSGSLSVVFVEPKCSASLDVAVEAQASCEASAGCEIDAECAAGEIAVSCSGSCTGGCKGGCEGEMKCSASVEADGTCGGTCEGTCEVKGPALECSGTCSGTCTVQAGATCEGTCNGNCTGTCDGSSAEGVACAGECEGECSAECHIQGSASCEGSCNGKCEGTPPSGTCEGTCKGECKATVAAEAECGGEVKCEGECTGECSGGCEGEVTPPSCSLDAECSAEANCDASASAQASASLECTPPSLEISFQIDASLSAQAKAEFKAKMGELKVKMIGIIQGMFKMRALIDAEYAAELGFEPPLVQITAAVEGLLSADLDSFDIPVGRLPCVLPAFQDSAEILASAATDLVVTFQAQLEIASVLNI